MSTTTSLRSKGTTRSRLPRRPPTSRAGDA
jgi:hypothetical protein